MTIEEQIEKNKLAYHELAALCLQYQKDAEMWQEAYERLLAQTEKILKKLYDTRTITGDSARNESGDESGTATAGSSKDSENCNDSQK